MTAARGNIAPRHLRTGAELGLHGEVDELVLECTACGTVQTETFPSYAPVRQAIAGVTCGRCSRVATMRMWRAR